MAVDFTAWLTDQKAVRCVLVEAVSSVNGSNVTRYLSSKNYTDNVAGRIYDPIIAAESIQLVERMSVDGQPSMSFGDIELYNLDGALDSWLRDIWVNKSITILIGDVRWLRADFTTIFSGTIDDIDSRSKDSINIKVRDKLQRLNVPISEVRLAGSSVNKNELIPMSLGECFNVKPLLSNPATLEYRFSHGGYAANTSEGVIEVRDNGVPVSYSYVGDTKTRFKLNAQPFGQVTASVQGLVSTINLLPYSEQFDHASWSKNGVTVTANNTTAPDGTATADKLEATLSDSYAGDSVTVLSSRVYTFSVWLRSDSTTTIRIYAGNSNGTAGNTPKEITVSTDWKRYYVTHTTSATTTIAFVQIGGGSNFTTGEIVYAWGAQFELSDIANSYARTSGSPSNVHLTSAAGIIRYIARNHQIISVRFFSNEIDLDNFQAFEEANPRPVGLYVESRENTLSVCNQIAASVGAQLVMSRLGKLQLLKIDLPASGTFSITTDDIIQNSLSITNKFPVQAALKLNYCKNWSVQTGLLTGIPEEHKKMYASEWASVTVEDTTVKADYALDAEPQPVDTLLLKESDAIAEATRLLNIYKNPVVVVSFTGTARLVELILGQAVEVTYPRFGLDTGALGQVIGLSIDWSNLTVKVDVLLALVAAAVAPTGNRIMREDGSFLLREDGSYMLRED